MMKKWMRIVIILLFLIIPIFSGPGVGRGDSLEDIVKGIRGDLETINSLQATFLLEPSSPKEGIGMSQKSKGTMLFKRPGKFHWYYQSPKRMEILSDGRKIWFYYPDEKQAMVSQINKNELSSQYGLVIDLLLGKDLLSLFGFQISPSEGKEGDQYLVMAKPLKSGVSERIEIMVDKKNLKVRNIIIKDPPKNIKRLELYDLRRNEEISEGQFTFLPPEGVELIYAPSLTP